MKKQADNALTAIVFKYAKSGIFYKLLQLLYAYIKPKLLGPELQGLWNLLNTIIDLSGYSHLGTRAAVKYAIPPLERENKLEEIKDIKGAVYFGTFYIIILIIIGLLITIHVTDYPLEYKVGLATVAALLLLDWQYEYFLAILKAQQKFDIIINNNYITPVIRLSMGVTLIYYFSIYGLFAATLLSSAITIAYFRFKYPSDLRNAFKFSVYKKLVQSGIGIMLFDSSLNILMITDRFIIPYFLGLKQLGYYSIALVISEIIMQIPGSSREVIEPKVAQLIAVQPIEKTLADYYFKPLYNIAYYCPFLIFGVFFALPPAVELLLPKYTEGVAAAQVLAFGTVFLGLSYTARCFIVMNHWQLKSIILVLITLIINLVLSVYFIQQFNLNIIGVALAAVISNAVLFVMFYSVVRSFYKQASSHWYHFFYILLPFFLSILIIPSAWHITSYYVDNHYLQALAGMIVASFIMYALIMVLNKSNSLVYCFKFKRIK